MGRPRRRHHGRGAPFFGEPNGLQPGDDVGNRRSFKQQQFPPDDLGNRRELAEELDLPNDDIGNRIDAAPTHEISGVLLELDGRRRRRKKGAPQERLGRYIVGGVNPMVAGNVERAVEALKEADERKQAERELARQNGLARVDSQEEGPDDDSRASRRRRRRRRDGRDPVDGVAAQEFSERRAQRFFDFEEDDRFEYVLTSDPEQKRKEAHHAVASVLSGAGRDALIHSRVLSDEARPKVVVTIDERGPADTLPPERRSDDCQEPLFVLGNAALMSLNYLVNKIVNRYPSDRIRLAILPAADESLYLDSLAEHRRGQTRETTPPVEATGAAARVIEVNSEVPPVSALVDDDGPTIVPGPGVESAGEDVVAAAQSSVVEGDKSIAPEPPARPGRKKATPRTRTASRTKARASVEPVADPSDDAGGEAQVSPSTSVAETGVHDDTAAKPTRKRASSRRTVVSESSGEGATEPPPRRATSRKANAAKKGRESGTLKEEP